VKKIPFYFLFCVLSFKFEVFPVFAQVIDPQYIFVRKDPMGCNPSDCSQLWNMDNPNQINLNAINDIYSKIGTKGTNSRKVGIGVVFNYWIGDFEKQKQSLATLLVYSKVHDFPIFLNFEGLGWWNNRPDLYNNPNNVEWTCWDVSCAINKSWRNWGSEFEVKPQPNLASPTLIQATKDALNQFIPIIVNWYKDLPNEKQYLLGGISLGGEVDIGANYYYYPNGVNNGRGLAGSVQLGYAAVKTAGIKSSGIITEGDINEVVRRYQTALDKTAYDLGIPRNKIYNHNGGKGAAPFMTYPTGVAFENLSGSLNNYAHPGWSFYGDVTANPGNYPNLVDTITQIGNGEWSSPEWLSWTTDYTGWATALRNSLNYRNNRFINVANWEGIRDKPYALQAIRDVANESPACWVTTPQLNISVNGNTATFNWIKGANNDSIHLNVSNTEGFTVSGTLANPNVIVENNTTKTSYTKSGLTAGKYYVILAADGCGNQRKINDNHFVIAAPPTSVPPTKIPTAIPTKTPITGDYNGDGVVNLADFGEWKKRYLAVPQTMTLTDFGIWKKAYLQQ